MPNVGISFIQEQRECMWMTHGGKYLQIFIFEGQTMKWPEAPAKLMWTCFQIRIGSHYNSYLYFYFSHIKLYLWQLKNKEVRVISYTVMPFKNLKIWKYKPSPGLEQYLVVFFHQMLEMNNIKCSCLTCTHFQVTNKLFS